MNYVLTVESKDKLCTCRHAFWVSIPFSSKITIFYLFLKKRKVVSCVFFFRSMWLLLNSTLSLRLFDSIEFQSRKSVRETQKICSQNQILVTHTLFSFKLTED